MGGGGSNKPIVFVFGAQKGDADGRKRNLSAINTQVAYRAHERRREKKSRQRAQAKEEEKTDESSSAAASSSNTIVAADDVRFSEINSKKICSPRIEDFNNSNLPSNPPSRLSQILQFSNTQSVQQVFSLNQDPRSRPQHGRRISNETSSDSSSEFDTTATEIWSTSPSSGVYSSPATDLTSMSPVPQVHINSYFDKALDPFFRLPGPATDREKWLVHFYFQEMGHIGFGTHPASLFCPDRDWVSTYVSTQPLCFQWLLILAEEQLGRMGVLPDQTKTIERKAKAYGALSSTLKSKVVNQDESIGGIMYAAIVDTSQTSIHLTALDRLIKETGGFEGFLDRPLGIVHPEHVATVYAFGKCPIANIDELDSTVVRFLNNLRDVREMFETSEEEKRRIRNRRPWDTISRQTVDANGVLVPSNHDEHFRYFVKAQQECFSSDCIGSNVNTVLDTSADYSTQARHFGVLTQLLFILQEFNYSYLAKAMFLRRLNYVAEMSSARDPYTRKATLSNSGILLINSFVRQEVQIYFDRTQTLAKGAKISSIVVDFLKIFPLLRPPARVLVASWLRDWLCPNEQIEGVKSLSVQESDLEAVAMEIRSSWFSEVRDKI